MTKPLHIGIMSAMASVTSRSTEASPNKPYSRRSFKKSSRASCSRDQAHPLGDNFILKTSPSLRVTRSELNSFRQDQIILALFVDTEGTYL